MAGCSPADVFDLARHVRLIGVAELSYNIGYTVALLQELDRPVGALNVLDIARRQPDCMHKMSLD